MWIVWRMQCSTRLVLSSHAHIFWLMAQFRFGTVKVGRVPVLKSVCESMWPCLCLSVCMYERAHGGLLWSWFACSCLSNGTDDFYYIWMGKLLSNIWSCLQTNIMILEQCKQGVFLNSSLISPLSVLPENKKIFKNKLTSVGYTFILNITEICVDLVDSRHTFHVPRQSPPSDWHRNETPALNI